MQEPQASESAALLSWAAHIALQAGDLVRCDTLLAALQAYRPITLLADERVAHLQGRIAAASGDLDAAVEHLNRALAKVRISLEEVESDTRAGGRAPDDRVRRQELTAMSADLRAELCDIHARCTDPQAAFVAAELLRGEFLRAARLNPPGTYAGLAAFLDRVIQQLPVGNEPRASAQRTAAEQAILQLRKQPLRELIDTPTPPPGNIAGDLQTILDAAGSTSCVVTLNLSPDALTLVATDGFRYCCDRVETNGQQLANQIRALFSRETSAGPNPDSPQWRTDAAQCVNRMQQLTARRIVSLARHLNRPDVILSTSGPLTCVPWAAVITDPQLTFSVTQGVTLAAEALSTHTRSPRATDVIVAPSGDQSIPAAALEAAAIAQTWKDAGRPTQLLAPVDQALLGQAAPRARVLHLASHASWNRTAAVSGGITLSEGRLDAGELFAALDLTRTDLAVLSACDTAASMFAPGGEAINLAQLVLSGAGAGQVIASLWPVDDLATGLLMVRLHEDLASRLTPSRALVKAQRWLQNLTYSMAITEVNRRWTQLPASVESRLDQWRTAPPNGHPFDGVEFYAAFGCFGVAPPQT